MMCKKLMFYKTLVFLCLMITYLQISGQVAAKISDKKFVHPGMLQGKKDLDFMKSKVNMGQQPWKNAFDNLKSKIDLNFKPQPQSHISVGAYGANNDGGTAFSKSATMANYCALMWYITGEQKYADKSIEILNAWSSVLWSFDDNNAKLNVGLFGPAYLNAAEILKYTGAGWQDKDIKQFKRMVMTVFYPTVKDYFTEANGNWDASIIYTLLCIGVFTENEAIFQSAIERFNYGPGNSGITKYIYPNGQIQETTRDWDHVQLGLGEFAKAAQTAWTQNVDLYSVANNRLALGLEYCSRFMLGDDSIPVYGVLSKRERDRTKDIFESVYDHYANVKGLAMPHTKKMIADKTRSSSLIGVLTGIRLPVKKSAPGKLTLIPEIPPVISLVGALKLPTVNIPANAIVLQPGDPIQKVLDEHAGKGRWVVLAKGVHKLAQPLVMPSGITLAGQGYESILTLDANLRSRTIVNGDKNMHDVVIRDLLIEGATSTETGPDPNAARRNRSYMNAPSREGVIFMSDHANVMQNIRMENVTVQNFTKNGVSIEGARNVVVAKCDFSDNGGNVVPGAGFHHNLNLMHVSNVDISDSRFDTSTWGSGINIFFGNHISVLNNEISRNKLSGISIVGSNKLNIKGNLAEGNDENGIHLDDLMDKNSDIQLKENLLINNGDHK